MIRPDNSKLSRIPDFYISILKIEIGIIIVMDVTELKKMLKNSTAVLILDNGEPSFVVVNYDLYKNLLEANKEKEVKVHTVNNSQIEPKVANNNEMEILERINKEILALKAEIENEEKNLNEV